MKKQLCICAALLALASSAAVAATLAETHQSKGVACAGCHAENPPSKPVDTAKCQTCHGDYQKLAERTKDMQPTNVHANHLGDLDCSECHSAHAESKLVCSDCHQFQFTMPGKKK